MNFKYYDFYYTVVKNRDEIEILIDEYENIENEYFNYDDFVFS